MTRLWLPVGLASLALIAAGAGAVAVVPVLVVAGVAAIFVTRLQVTALVLVAVALVADNPGERPMEGKWQSPLYGIGSLLYENLHHHTGIGALRFSLLEAAGFGLLALLAIRIVRGDRTDAADARPLGVSPIAVAFGLFLATLIALEAWGLARGGDFKNSLWQARQLFWLPLLGLLFGRALTTSDARTHLLRIIVAVAVVRCLVGIYFTFAIAQPAGWQLEYTMTHSDAILTVVAMLIAGAALIERPSLEHALLNFVAQPILLLGLHVNDRRIAFVALAGGGLALVLMGPVWLRTLVRRGLLVLVPAMAIYVAIGWNSTSPVFSPVSTLRAVITSEDTSSQTRDIENYNLIQTLKRQPLIGSGFGHEYVELVQAYRVDHLFAQYRFIAHNSVLWLLSLSGWIGFASLWTLFPAGVAVALLVHRRADQPLDRVLAFATVAATISYLVQAWGDMGFQSWIGTLVMASLLGATGALYTRQSTGEVAC